MSINTCKECGKQFEASSPRVAYCSDVHYRPCPVCGKPVEAKYLSDPARRCEDCKGKGKITPKARVRAVAKQTLGFTSPAQSVVDVTPTDPNYINGPGTYVRTYTGRSACKFETGHKYTIIVSDFHDYRYDITAVVDHTLDEDVNLLISASSRISINQMFVADK